MRSFLSILSLFLFSFSLSGQVLDPVKWTIESKKVDDTTFDLVFTAKMEKTWTVYSQYTGDDGPLPTMIEYDDLGNVKLDGKATEKGHKKSGPDPLFDGVTVVKYLDDEPFEITQRIKTTDLSKPIVGYLTFMTCDATRCLPPKDVDFSIDLTKATASTNTKNTTAGASSFGSVEGVDSAKKKSKKVLNPVSWKLDIEDLGNKEFNIVYTASIEKNWTVYSQFTSDNGPVPTILEFEDLGGAELIGKSEEFGHKKEGPDALFDGVNVIKYLDDENFVIKQKVKAGKGPIKGYLTYMTCDASRCLPPTDVDFYFDLQNGIAANKMPAAKADVGMNIKGDVFNQKIESIFNSFNAPVSDCGEVAEIKSKSMWGIFIGGFLGGLAAILLPCIFPMIPITVSFFTKDTKTKGWVNGLIYGLSIIVIFVGIGMLVTALLGPEALNKLSTSWIANTIFFVIFVAFAISFFGYFEIALPASWSTKTDSMADKGGLLGTFFMAATLAIVSFSCTGPIIGSALVQVASQGSYIGPAVVMFGFSLALAIPFGLFAAFPSLLNSLPRSGGWMTSVKVILGFLELALALKFLSVADMTSHWGFLRYELFLGLWVIIFFCMALYLMGYIRFPHDSKLQKIGPLRWGFIALTLGMSVYLAMGFTYNDATKTYNTPKLTSGLAPPATYNFFLSKPELDQSIKAKYSSYTKCANNINCFKDYYDGVAYANEVNKPMLIDFTGYGCVNCRKTEEHIWVNEEVRKMLNEDYILVSLYVDDREKLDKTYLSTRPGYKIRNVGNKWTDFQVVNFENNAQPLYIPMSKDQQVLLKPRPYKEGIEPYIDFLKCGLKANASIN